jgi:hypothetical protein
LGAGITSVSYYVRPLFTLQTFFSSGDGTQDCTHARQVLYHWANTSSLQGTFKNLWTLIWIFRALVVNSSWKHSQPHLHLCSYSVGCVEFSQSLCNLLIYGNIPGIVSTDFSVSCCSMVWIMNVKSCSLWI